MDIQEKVSNYVSAEFINRKTFPLLNSNNSFTAQRIPGNVEDPLKHVHYTFFGSLLHPCGLYMSIFEWHFIQTN